MKSFIAGRRAVDFNVVSIGQIVSVFLFEGSVQDAQRVSCHSDGRAPKFVLDNIICGLHRRCYVPEQNILPNCTDVHQYFPLWQFDGDHYHMGVALDGKMTRKRIVLRARHWSLVRFGLEGHIFYRVVPYWTFLGVVVKVGLFFVLPFFFIYWSGSFMQRFYMARGWFGKCLGFFVEAWDYF